MARAKALLRRMVATLGGDTAALERDEARSVRDQATADRESEAGAGLEDDAGDDAWGP